MSVLDWLLVAVGLAYAVSGYWQGFICGAFATAGLLLGGLTGIWLAPLLLGDAAPSLWVTLGALLVVLMCASFGQGILQFAGARIRNTVTWRPARALDAVGGAALSTGAVLVVAWALGVAVSGADLWGVNRQVRDSEVLRRVDAAMPERADEVLKSFNDLVGDGFFPQYLEPFVRERIPDVPPPASAVTRDADVRAAAISVLKIRGQSSCGRGVEGSGFLYAPGRVMTNAHVVSAVDRPEVSVGQDEVEGRVVYYNPDVDIAVIAVDGVDRPFLRFDSTAESRDPAAVLGFPNDGPYDVQPARVRQRQRLRSPDIYGGGTVTREVLSIRSLVRPGNSGGPLVSTDGKVLGVIFAASVTDSQTGYALTGDQVAQAAAGALDATAPVATGPCT